MSKVSLNILILFSMVSLNCRAQGNSHGMFGISSREERSNPSSQIASSRQVTNLSELLDDTLQAIDDEDDPWDPIARVKAKLKPADMQKFADLYVERAASKMLIQEIDAATEYFQNMGLRAHPKLLGLSSFAKDLQTAADAGDLKYLESRRLNKLDPELKNALLPSLIIQATEYRTGEVTFENLRTITNTLDRSQKARVVIAYIASESLRLKDPDYFEKFKSLMGLAQITSAPQTLQDSFICTFIDNLHAEDAFSSDLSNRYTAGVFKELNALDIVNRGSLSCSTEFESFEEKLMALGYSTVRTELPKKAVSTATSQLRVSLRSCNFESARSEITRNISAAQSAPKDVLMVWGIQNGLPCSLQTQIKKISTGYRASIFVADSRGQTLLNVENSFASIHEIIDLLLVGGR